MYHKSPAFTSAQASNSPKFCTEIHHTAPFARIGLPERGCAHGTSAVILPGRAPGGGRPGPLGAQRGADGDPRVHGRPRRRAVPGLPAGRGGRAGPGGAGPGGRAAGRVPQGIQPGRGGPGEAPAGRGAAVLPVRGDRAVLAGDGVSRPAVPRPVPHRPPAAHRTGLVAAGGERPAAGPAPGGGTALPAGGPFLPGADTARGGEPVRGICLPGGGACALAGGIKFLRAAFLWEIFVI